MVSYVILSPAPVSYPCPRPHSTYRLSAFTTFATMPEPNEATPDAPFSTTGPTLQATTNSQSATTAKATAGSDAPLANGAPLDVVSAVDSMTTAMKSVLPSSGTDIPSSGGAPAAPSVEHTTQPAQAPGTTVVPPTAEEEDPKVTSLRAMFPDFDVAILYVQSTQLRRSRGS